MTTREKLFAGGAVILLLMNLYAWYKPDGGNKPNVPDFTPPGTITKPTVTYKCPETGIQGIDPAKLKHDFAVSQSKVKELTAKLAAALGNKEVKVVEKYPDWFDPNKTAILADAEIPAWKAKTYVVSTLDLTTGKGGISYKQLPRPPVAFENEARVGINYLFIGDDAGKVMLYGQYTPFRIGSWYLSGYGQAIGSRFNAGAGVEYRW